MVDSSFFVQWLYEKGAIIYFFDLPLYQCTKEIEHLSL